MIKSYLSDKVGHCGGIRRKYNEFVNACERPICLFYAS